MQESSTPDLLLLFAYNELQGKQRTEMEKLLENDSNLRSEFNDIQQIRRELDRSRYAPNPTSVQIILEESLNSQLEAHE